MPKGKRTPRSHHKKNVPKHPKPATQGIPDAQGLNGAQPTPSQMASVDGEGAGIIETYKDLQLFKQVRTHPDWVMPENLATELPNDLNAMRKNEKLKEGTRLAAARELRSMVKDNVAKNKTHITLSNYVTRHSHAEKPQADEEVKADTIEQTTVIEPVAFHEKTSLEESADVIETLRQLGRTELLGTQYQTGGTNGQGNDT